MITTFQETPTKTAINEQSDFPVLARHISSKNDYFIIVCVVYNKDVQYIVQRLGNTVKEYAKILDKSQFGSYEIVTNKTAITIQNNL